MNIIDFINIEPPNFYMVLYVILLQHHFLYSSDFVLVNKSSKVLLYDNIRIYDIV